MREQTYSRYRSLLSKLMAVFIKYVTHYSYSSLHPSTLMQLVIFDALTAVFVRYVSVRLNLIQVFVGEAVDVERARYGPLTGGGRVLTWVIFAPGDSWRTTKFRTNINTVYNEKCTSKKRRH